MNVRQVRVLRNVLIGCGGWGLVLWWLRDELWAYRYALGLGCLVGLAVGSGYWWHLRRRIARRDRRYERNKIWVHYLSWVEALMATVAYNPYLAIPLGLLLLAVVVLGVFSAHGWTVLASSLGFTATAVVAGWTVGYEQRHGPLYYQYNTETWSGAEGLLYQVGTVMAPLCPSGKVKLQGALWNAVSLSGEAIEVGEQVEVIAIEGLTLYVDHLTPAQAPHDPEERRTALRPNGTGKPHAVMARYLSSSFCPGSCSCVISALNADIVFAAREATIPQADSLSHALSSASISPSASVSRLRCTRR